MKWAERATKRLECRYDLNILSIPSSLKVAERDDFDQIEERHGFVASQVVPVPDRSLAGWRLQLRAESLLLVIASGVEIGAIQWDMKSALRRCSPQQGLQINPSEGRARAFATTIVTIRAQAHFFVPSAPGLGGGGMNP